MARAFVRHALTLRAQQLFYAGFFVLCMLLWLVLFDGDSATPGAMLFWAVLLAGATTVALVVLTLLLGYVRTVRGARVRLFPGAVLESGFGESHMVLRNPLAESRISYRSVRTLVARGDFVFLQHHGSPVVAVYPRDLFPADALARIRQRTLSTR
jgi:hypothetical protein